MNMNKRPLIHCITNFVAMNFTANALLAVGAVPFMSSCVEEMDEIVSRSDAVLINIGCIDNKQAEAMREAVKAARKYGKPWILDPVGVQLTDYRFRICSELINLYSPTVIKGNASEMSALSSLTISLNDCVLVQTGAVDIITQGSRREEIKYGDNIMTQVTAMGCVAGGIIAAFVSKESDTFLAVVEAMTLVGKAGENAKMNCNGTGSFKTEFIDELYKRTTKAISCD